MITINEIKITRFKKMIIVFIVVSLIIGGLYYYFSKQTPEMTEKKLSFLSELKKLTTKEIDMLIFISPQYANDIQIQQAISEYINVVKNDIGWRTKIINLTSDINDFRKIDEIIENYYNKTGGRLKASIMVGEDINTALSAEGEGLGIESPSITPWSTNDNYIMLKKNETKGCSGKTVEEMLCKVKDKNTGELIEKFKEKDGRVLKFGKVVGEPKRIDVVISLIYPPHNLDYQVRSQKIRSVFQKFSQNRNKIHPKKSMVFIDTFGMDSYKDKTFQVLDKYSEMYYKKTPTQEEIQNSLDEKWMIYYAGGHATPNQIHVSPPPNVSIFYVKYLKNLNTPIFLGSGCNVNGWQVNDWEGNEKLDFSNNENWFGAKMFINPYLRAAILGIPSQSGGKNFIEIAIPDLMKGKTLAESLIGDILYNNIDEAIIFGDPTFHFNF